MSPSLSSLKTLPVTLPLTLSTPLYSQVEKTSFSIIFVHPSMYVHIYMVSRLATLQWTTDKGVHPRKG